MRAEVDSAISARAAAGPRRPRAADDGELLRRARAGERNAFAALIARHGGALLRFARILYRDETTARDLVEETWLTALDGAGGRDEAASLRTFLFRILAERAKGRAMGDGGIAPVEAPSARDPAVAPERFDATGAWADPPARWIDDTTPEELAFQRETGELIEAAVDELPRAQRAVLVLRDVEGLEVEEIRDVLDIGVTELRALLHRARARVTGALARDTGESAASALGGKR